MSGLIFKDASKILELIDKKGKKWNENL
jgi:hypothetical protein